MSVLLVAWIYLYTPYASVDSATAPSVPSAADSRLQPSLLPPPALPALVMVLAEPPRSEARGVSTGRTRTGVRHRLDGLR